MKTTAEIIQNYQALQEKMPGSSILHEVRNQYADMADGGNGGRLYYSPPDWEGSHPDGPTCREYNYPDKTDAFFQEVRVACGWL